MDSFTIVVLLMLAFYIGYKFGLNKLGQTAIDSIRKNADKLVPMYYIEYEQDNYYVYDKDTSLFICQGKTLDDVSIALNNAKKTFAIIATPNGNNFELKWFINGKFKQFDQ